MGASTFVTGCSSSGVATMGKIRSRSDAKRAIGPTDRGVGRLFDVIDNALITSERRRAAVGYFENNMNLFAGFIRRNETGFSSESC